MEDHHNEFHCNSNIPSIYVVGSTAYKKTWRVGHSKLGSVGLQQTNILGLISHTLAGLRRSEGLDEQKECCPPCCSHSPDRCCTCCSDCINVPASPSKGCHVPVWQTPLSDTYAPKISRMYKKVYHISFEDTILWKAKVDKKSIF